MKIREIYTVVREYFPRKRSSLEDMKNHCLFVSDEAGEFLYGGSCGKESLPAQLVKNQCGRHFQKIKN